MGIYSYTADQLDLAAVSLGESRATEYARLAPLSAAEIACIDAGATALDIEERRVERLGLRYAAPVWLNGDGAHGREAAQVVGTRGKTALVLVERPTGLCYLAAAVDRLSPREALLSDPLTGFFPSAYATEATEAHSVGL